MPGYYKRQYNRSKRVLRRRYTKKTNSGRKKLNLNKVVRDISYLKNSLNVEHKQACSVWGSKDSTDEPCIIFSPLYGDTEPYLNPTNDSPTIEKIAVPGQGTQNMNRIGNSIKLTNISARFRVSCYLKNFHGGGDRLATPTATLLIGFSKLNNLPTISDIFLKDAAGEYTRSSYRNPDTYKNYMIIYSKKVYLNPTGISQIPNSTSGSNQIIERFINMNKKMNLKLQFVTGMTGSTEGASNHTTLENLTPFFILMTNSRGTDDDAYSEVQAVGEIKLSYVDN